VANASHELRTPLARQRAIAQVALADPDATTTALLAAHEKVLASGAEQERLIEALLTLARSQAGIENQDPLDLCLLTEEILLTRQPEAERVGLNVHADLSHAPTFGDRRLLERLIANLVDNAIHHNIAGGRVEVRTRTHAAQSIVSVRNTGQLIPADAIERLTQPFTRLAPDRTGRDDGIGLGLSIILAIAEAHDATLTIDSQPEGGLRVQASFRKRESAIVGPATSIPVESAGSEPRTRPLVLPTRERTD
jgi:signal transduction histidine kinase